MDGSGPAAVAINSFFFAHKKKHSAIFLEQADGFQLGSFLYLERSDRVIAVLVCFHVVDDKAPPY